MIAALLLPSPGWCPNRDRQRRLQQGMAGGISPPALAMGAASFNGAVPNYLGAPSSSSLQFAAHSFSSVFWYNIAAAPGAFTAFYNKGNQTTAGDEWGVQITNTNAISAFASDGGAYSAQTLVSLTTGSWQMIYWGWDQANMWFVVSANDGAIATGSAQTHPPQATGNAFQMGVGGDRATRGLTALMDSVGGWNRLLTQGEIDSLWNGGAGLKVKNYSGTLKNALVWGWDLDGPWGDGKWRDAVAGNHLTNTGGVLAVSGHN